MPHIKSNSKNIYYEEYGKEHPHSIVYFHGGPGEGCWSFAQVARELGEKYHVVIFDQYGVLRSDAIPEDESCVIAEHIEIIEELRKQLNIEKCTVLGHSYGGMLACLYAHTHPERAHSVIYDNPTWNWLLTARTIASTLQPYFQDANNSEAFGICAKVLSDDMSSRDSFDSIFALMSHGDDKMHENMRAIDVDVYNQYVEKHNLRVYVDDWQKYKIHQQKLFENDGFADDYLPLLKEIAVPSLLMVGEYDITCGEEQQEYFIQNAPNRMFVEFENCAHLLWMQQPEVYIKTIVDFLDKIS